MDSSYNDPNYIPLYSLDGIDEAIIAVCKVCLLLYKGKLIAVGSLRANRGEVGLLEEKHFTENMLCS